MSCVVKKGGALDGGKVRDLNVYGSIWVWLVELAQMGVLTLVGIETMQSVQKIEEHKIEE